MVYTRIVLTKCMGIRPGIEKERINSECSTRTIPTGS